MSNNLITKNLPYIIGSCLCGAVAYTTYQQYAVKTASEAHKAVASAAPASNLELAKTTYKQGVDLYKQGKYADAATAYTKTLSLAPNFAPAHTALGLTALKQNNIDQAIGYTNKSIAVNHTYTPAYLLLGQIYQSKKETKTAQEWYEKALVHDENLFEAHLALVQLLSKVASKDAYVQALDHAKKALKLKPFDKDTLLALGNAHLTVNNVKTAQTTYEITLETYPDCYEALVGLGATKKQANEDKEALAYFKRALAINSNENLKTVVADLNAQLKTQVS